MDTTPATPSVSATVTNTCEGIFFSFLAFVSSNLKFILFRSFSPYKSNQTKEKKSLERTVNEKFRQYETKDFIWYSNEIGTTQCSIEIGQR